VRGNRRSRLPGGGFLSPQRRPDRAWVVVRRPLLGNNARSRACSSSPKGPRLQQEQKSSINDRWLSESGPEGTTVEPRHRWPDRSSNQVRAMNRPANSSAISGIIVVIHDKAWVLGPSIQYRPLTCRRQTTEISTILRDSADSLSQTIWHLGRRRDARCSETGQNDCVRRAAATSSRSPGVGHSAP
jgi:hypothetical protein